MKFKPISLAEFKQTVVKSRDNACANLEAAGDNATFTERFLAESAQAQVEFLNEMSDEPLTIAELEAQEVAPHLLERLKSESSAAQVEISVG